MGGLESIIIARDARCISSLSWVLILDLSPGRHNISPGKRGLMIGPQQDATRIFGKGVMLKDGLNT